MPRAGSPTPSASTSPAPTSPSTSPTTPRDPSTKLLQHWVEGNLQPAHLQDIAAAFRSDRETPLLEAQSNIGGGGTRVANSARDLVRVCRREYPEQIMECRRQFANSFCFLVLCFRFAYSLFRDGKAACGRLAKFAMVFATTTV